MDLTAAVDAAAQRVWAEKRKFRPELREWEYLPDFERHVLREHVLPVVTAAAPAIAAQALRQAIHKIEEKMHWLEDVGQIDMLHSLAEQHEKGSR